MKMKRKLLAALAVSLMLAVATNCSDENTTLAPSDTVTVEKQVVDTVEKKVVINDTTIVNGDTTIVEKVVEKVVEKDMEKTLTSPIIVDDSIKAGEIVTLDASIEYTLDGFVYVEEGAELHIPAGTVIKGNPGQGVDASALIICRGAKIYAEGTADAPIIFTASVDDLSDQTDLAPTDVGLWGGLIILGKSPLNFLSNDGKSGSIGGEANVEGIPETELRGRYGGSDPADNSGIIKYVSIRHGGSNIGADNEINGLSLGAVGSGTTIDYLEVFANQDDGIEFFGSTVGVKHAVITYCGDDSFDYDQSFRGKGQFWFTQKSSIGDKAGEHDGGPSSNETGTPYAIPTIYNATYIGSGMTNTETGKAGINMRDNAGGHYANSIFANFYGVAVEIEDLETGGDSRTMMDNGDLTFEDNVFYNIGSKTGAAVADVKDAFKIKFEKWTPDSTEEADAKEDLVAKIATWGNTIEDPALGSYDLASGIDPVPTVDVEGTLAATPTDSFFDKVSYKGAFKAGENWMKGWTALDSYGLLK